MKKRVLAALMAALLVTLSPITAFAAEHEVGTWDEIRDIVDTDEDAEVILTLKTDIVFENWLTTKVGQKITLNGVTYVLQNVMITGDGEAEINGNIGSTEYHEGLLTDDSCTVVVNGNVTSSGASVKAQADSTVTVNGNVDSEEEGIRAEDNATVNVNGNVTSSEEEGVDAIDSATVTVNGDVSGVEGVSAGDTATVTVNGNVSGLNGNPDDVDYDDPYDDSDGGEGVYASGSATVTVTGDVTGGNAYGTFGYGGDAVLAWENATVTVGGNVSGGNVTANPDTIAEGDAVSRGGIGVAMESTAQVSVGGNVTGGSTNGDQGTAGDGVYISLVLKGDADDADNEGSLNIGGTLSNGINSKGNGTDGDAMRYEFEERDLTLLSNDLTPEQQAELDEYVIPEVTIYQIDVKGNGTTVSVDGIDNEDDNKAIAEFLNAEVIKYAIKTETPENGTLSVDKTEAIAGESVTVTATPNDGYQVKSVQVYGRTLEAKDGQYSFEVEENGGTTVSAVFEKIGSGQNDTEKLNTTAKSVATGDTTSVFIYVLMMGAAALCIMTMVLRKRSK